MVTNPTSQLAIETLILDRCKILGLSRTDLVRRAGYRNEAKGLRRLDELCSGEMKTTVSLIGGLPTALTSRAESSANVPVRQSCQIS
jgi:hypothetical protein